MSTVFLIAVIFMMLGVGLKTDLRDVRPEAAGAGAVCAVSVKTGHGMDGLEET